MARPLVHLSADDVIVLRAERAADMCSCGHLRRDHYASTGATVGCGTCCCWAYTWSRPELLG